MAWETIVAISITIVGIVLTPFLYIWRMTVSRIEMLELEVKDKTTQAEVRQILADRLDPIKEDLEEIKRLQEKIIDLHLKK